MLDGEGSRRASEKWVFRIRTGLRRLRRASALQDSAADDRERAAAAALLTAAGTECDIETQRRGSKTKAVSPCLCGI